MVSAIKLSEYDGSHVVLNDEVEYVECLHEMLDNDELEVNVDVRAVDERPMWGHIITAERVWELLSDYLYDEVECNDDPYEYSEDNAKKDLVEALNAWAAKHLTGTVLVGTKTRIDISELFERAESCTPATDARAHDGGAQ